MVAQWQSYIPISKLIQESILKLSCGNRFYHVWAWWPNRSSGGRQNNRVLPWDMTKLHTNFQVDPGKRSQVIVRKPMETDFTIYGHGGPTGRLGAAKNIWVLPWGMTKLHTNFQVDTWKRSQVIVRKRKRRKMKKKTGKTIRAFRPKCPNNAIITASNLINGVSFNITIYTRITFSRKMARKYLCTEFFKRVCCNSLSSRSMGLQNRQMHWMF